MKSVSERVNMLPKWAREYIHNVSTFVGAPEVQELTYLRNQNEALIKLVKVMRVRRAKANTHRLCDRRSMADWAAPTILSKTRSGGFRRFPCPWYRFSLRPCVYGAAWHRRIVL